MEVAVPLTGSPEFYFSGALDFPYASAPSSPFSFGEPLNYHSLYPSEQSSPSRAAAVYSQIGAGAYATPDSRISDDDDGEDTFVFAFPSGMQNGSGDFQLPEITTADKLFENGRVRSPQVWGRTSSVNSSGNGRRRSRSFSPRRDDGLPKEKPTSPADREKGGASRKWPRLMDLLLFRSASEGRATGRGSKDLLLKYTLTFHISLSKKKPGDNKKANGGESVRRVCRPTVSPYEKHYRACRAAEEERRRKTPLPFQQQGLLGLIRFNPPIRGKNKEIGTL